MIRKRSKDDEIPLTVSKSTILQETKARFDTLLQTALSQDDEVQKNNGKKEKKASIKSNLSKESKPSRKRSKKKLSCSTQMLVSAEGHSTSSETDAQEYSSDLLPASKLDDEVKDFTFISSSDELILSPVSSTGKTKAMIYSNDSVMEAELLSTPPKRPVPFPQKRNSTRDESRETTSSRVSSADSVMTAIEAFSPNKSIKLSSPEHKSLKEKEMEEYELKPLKGFAPSYEEIDETGLHKIETHQEPAEQISTGMANAASYEEILEEQSKVRDLERHDSDSNQGMSYESVRHERRNIQSKRTKTHVSLQNRIVKEESENTDTSSNTKIQVPTKHKRQLHIRKKDISATENDNLRHIDVQYTYEKIIGLTLHCCDTLKIDSLIQHPMVRVHVIDSITGEYLKKSQPSRNVSFFQENSNIDYIQPLASKPCNFKDPRSLVPIWEETLLLNEDIKHILQPNCSVLILFEVLDCVSFDYAVAQYRRLGLESGWHRIAWAFLKPCGPNNILNIDKRLRLQLYKPRFEKTYRSISVCDKCDVYRWWSKGGWIQYPSTLHVSVHSLPMPSDVTPALRSYFALQPEQCPLISDISDDAINGVSHTRGPTPLSVAGDVIWSRLPSQSCKVPNEKELDLSAGLNGSFSIKFNHQGNKLAVTAVNRSVHNIYVYRIPEGSEVARFQGHPGLVYNLEWSSNDELLVSASADCTACIWSIKTQKYEPLQMLPHPSFVYSVVFLPSNPLSLATGCCDHVIRIWTQSEQTCNFELQQELNSHEGYISALCVSSSGDLFSGDSTGEIRIWQCREDKVWKELRVVNVRELQGVVLSHLILHPGGKRMLVVARDSLLRMIDISTGVAIQWFKGALNHRIHSKACISPCGGLVFSPSEDSTFYVWNADTGVLIASYSDLFYTTQQRSSQNRPSHKPQLSTSILSGAVDYHPFDHLIAFSVYGAHSPVIICKYNRNLSGNEIGLQIKHDRQGDFWENENLEPKIISFPQSAFLATNVKAQIKRHKDNGSLKQSEDFQDPPLNLTGDRTERPLKGENQHLSYIIKQLDYVLQLGRASKQKQLGIVTPQHTTPGSVSVTPDSSLQVSRSPSNFHVMPKSNFTIQNVEEIDNEVSYSIPHSNVTEQQHSEPDEVLITSPVQLHYVQEKPPRPMPRQRRLKPSQLDRHQSVAELSTTDTSLLSSENEDSVNSVIAKPQLIQVFHENEVSYGQELKATVSTYKQVHTEQNVQSVSSFDSDSDARPADIK